MKVNLWLCWKCLPQISKHSFNQVIKFFNATEQTSSFVKLIWAGISFSLLILLCIDVARWMEHSHFGVEVTAM